MTTTRTPKDEIKDVFVNSIKAIYGLEVPFIMKKEEAYNTGEMEKLAGCLDEFVSKAAKAFQKDMPSKIEGMWLEKYSGPEVSKYHALVDEIRALNWGNPVDALRRTYGRVWKMCSMIYESPGDAKNTFNNLYGVYKNIRSMDEMGRRAAEEREREGRK